MTQLPYNDSGIHDIFMTRDKADLDVWQQEELIMDQLKENCILLKDPALFKKLYDKEIQRRSYSFFMRKEVKIGGRNLEEIKDSLGVGGQDNFKNTKKRGSKSPAKPTEKKDSRKNTPVRKTKVIFSE